MGLEQEQDFIGAGVHSVALVIDRRALGDLWHLEQEQDLVGAGVHSVALVIDRRAKDPGYRKRILSMPVFMGSLWAAAPFKSIIRFT